MKKLLLSLTCVFAVCMASTAHADTFRYYTSNGGGSIGVVLNGSSTASSLYASTFVVENKTTSAYLDVFCVQPTVIMKTGVDTEYTQVPGGFGANEWLLKRLIQVISPQIQDNPADSIIYKAALQTAIWETVVDSNSPFNLETGNFQVTGYYNEAGTRLQDIVRASYLTAMDASIKLEGKADIFMWSSADSQNLLSYTYDRTATTPIPAAAWLLGSGIAGLVAYRRRNNG